MENKAPMRFGGILSAVICWAVFILTDLIDEIILDRSNFIGMAVMLVGPAAAAVYYIVGCVKNKPDWVDLLLWNIGFYIAAVIVSVPICLLVNEDNWIIPQNGRGGFMTDFNGVEYLIFPFWFFGLTLIITVIFHIVYAIVKAVRKNKANN